jgi:hypothetical protein
MVLGSRSIRRMSDIPVRKHAHIKDGEVQTRIIKHAQRRDFSTKTHTHIKDGEVQTRIIKHAQRIDF